MSLIVNLKEFPLHLVFSNFMFLRGSMSDVIKATRNAKLTSKWLHYCKPSNVLLNVLSKSINSDIQARLPMCAQWLFWIFSSPRVRKDKTDAVWLVNMIFCSSGWGELSRQVWVLEFLPYSGGGGISDHRW